MFTLSGGVPVVVGLFVGSILQVRIFCDISFVIFVPRQEGRVAFGDEHCPHASPVNAGWHSQVPFSVQSPFPLHVSFAMHTTNKN